MGFLAIENGLRPQIIFLLTVPRRLLCVFVSASVVSYVAFVLSLFMSHLSYFWCLGRVLLCDCGVSRVSSRTCLYVIAVVFVLRDCRKTFRAGTLPLQPLITFPVCVTPFFYIAHWRFCVHRVLATFTTITYFMFYRLVLDI